MRRAFKFAPVLLLLLAIPFLTGWIQQPCNYFPLPQVCGGTGVSNPSSGIAGAGACPAGQFVTGVNLLSAPSCAATSTPAEFYLGFQTNQIDSALGAPNTSQSWQTYKLVNPITIDNCTATWFGWSCANAYPAMAIWNLTQNKLICSALVANAQQNGTPEALQTNNAAAGDMIGVINYTPGSTCTPTNGQMISFTMGVH